MAQRPPMHLDPHTAAAVLAQDPSSQELSDSELELARERAWSGQIIALPTRKAATLQQPRAKQPTPTRTPESEKEDDFRPPGYDYLGILKSRMNQDMSRIFNGEMVYPRQLEFHLASNGKEPCNFHCGHCQGSMGDQSLDLDTRAVLKLIEMVDGRTEYVIFGGQYTEPTMDPLLLDCLLLVKKVGSNFGLTTNGSLLRSLEEDSRFLTQLCEAAEEGDYITISLDAGLPESHRRSKVTTEYWFDEIITGLRLLGQIKEATNSPLTLRICYLFNRWNMGVDEIENIVSIASELPLASLRFSVPYALYGHQFNRVRRYRERWELPMSEQARELLAPYVSKKPDESPYIFYFGPEHQDVERMDFSKCVHGYYQLTVAADGYVYRCSSIAQPLFAWGRLGAIPDSREALETMILRNQDDAFDCSTCFEHGARCNRVALETNTWYDQIHGGDAAL
jgi:MoaA/NifB/PqqE/SkfB family radical SAM enzyme